MDGKVRGKTIGDTLELHSVINEEKELEIKYLVYSVDNNRTLGVFSSYGEAFKSIQDALDQHIITIAESRTMSINSIVIDCLYTDYFKIRGDNR